MEAKKQGWTQEDKNWAMAGAGIALVGGLYWYSQSQKADTEPSNYDPNSNYIDSKETVPSGTANNPKSPTKTTTATPTPVISNTRQPDAVRYKVGQEMMAIGSSGTPTYKTRKAANGTYINEGVKGNTIRLGDKIGTIIWVGTMADGTFRYVLENKGVLYNDLYWITDYRLMKPIDNSKPVSTTASVAMNKNLLLKMGSKGLEVRELQRLLGITIDGDFGTKTLTALQSKKGVSQITLANFATTNTAVLNFNLMLKKGSKGLEVKELQKRLGMTGSNIDGDFGAKTESALFAMKGVRQTTLNQFNSK